jgi:4-amino-4-deoxy-L-arabinose transferase-like glycosyltransferase
MSKTLLATFLLLAITALLVRAIPSTHMHADEELSYLTTTGHSLSYVVQYEATNDVHPPLWYATFWAWQQLVGDSEFAGRLHAILFSILTLSLAYRIGKDWFGGSRYGLLVMVVLGVNAYFFVYSLDIRPYAMTMCAVTFSMWMFQRWLSWGRSRAAIGYGISVALMLYIHYYTIFIVVVQGIIFLVSRPSRKLLKQYIGVAVVAFGLWAVWIPVVIHQLMTIRRLAGQMSEGSFTLGAPTEPTALALPKLLQISTNGLTWLTALVLLFGFVKFWRERVYWIAILWAILVPALLLIANLFAAIYTQRYISFISVGLAVAVGAALLQLPSRVRSYALIGFVGLNLLTLPSQLPVRPPYRVLLQELSRTAKPGDVIFQNRAGGPLNWQIDHYLSPDLQQNILTDAETTLEKRRIWYTTSEWQNPEVRAQFDQIQRTHPLQQVIGDCNVNWCYLIQLLEAPPLTQPIDFEDNMTFWGIDIDSVTSQEIRSRLWWRSVETPSADYSIGLYLLDSSGALVAQSDGPINNFGTTRVLTTQLVPDALYIDYRWLALPSVPPGQYQLALAVYRWTDNVRLKLSDGTDLLMLDTIMLP